MKDPQSTFVRIGDVIDRIFRDGVSLECLRDVHSDQASESED